MIFRQLQQIILISLALFVLAKSASARLTPERLTFGQDRVSIPLIPHNDRLFVTVEIEEKEYRFLFDTGALTVVSQSLAKRHNLDDDERIRITDSNNKRQSMGFTKISELRLAELSVSALPATIFPDDNPLFRCLGIQGILGANAFNRTTLEINVSEQMIVVIKSYSEELPNALKTNNQNSPYLVTRLGQSETTFFFDSGSSRHGEISKRSYKKQKNLFTEAAKLRGIPSWGVHGFAKPERITLYKADDFHLSSTRISGYPMVLGDNDILGAPLLNYGILILDFESRRWDFRPYETQPKTDFNRVSIMPLPQGEMWQVGTIHQSLKGIRIGDEVIAIEDIDLKERSLCDIINGDLKEDIKYKKITIRTKKGDVTHTVYPLGEMLE